jgi:hypothetical protein
MNEGNVLRARGEIPKAPLEYFSESMTSRKAEGMQRLALDEVGVSVLFSQDDSATHQRYRSSRSIRCDRWR